MNQNYYRIVDEDVTEIANSDLPWGKLKNKTILITGANGYLPAYMVFTLLKRNDLFQDNIHIVALCRNEEKARDRFEPMLGRNDLEFLIQDVCNPIQYNKKVDVVVHAASPSRPQVWVQQLVETMKANTLGLGNVLEFSRRAKSEDVLYFSSSAVYGSSQSESLLKEVDLGYSDCINHKFAYCEAKRAGEMLCTAYFLQCGTPVKIIRPSIIYGPGIPINSGSAMGDFLYNTLQQVDISIKSDGKAVRAYCYLKDATEAFFRVLFSGTNGRAYNIGSRENLLSVKELAEFLCQLFQEQNLHYNILDPDAQLKNFNTGINRVVVDTTELENLGWEEKTLLLEGIKRTLTSLREGNEC